MFNKEIILNNRMEKEWWLYLTAGILSFLIFCLIYGTSILNPTYTDWLLTEDQDLTQHYLGWKAYRYSKWFFPIGNMDTLAFPSKVSVIYTDSIPLLAVFFKTISFLLPFKFQYFGIWGGGSFLLQGIISTRIIYTKTKNWTASLISSIFFTTAPIFIFRMFAHTSLAGQWILLLALEIIVCRERFTQNRVLKRMMALGILAASIHMYYVPMIGMVLLSYCIGRSVVAKKWKESLLNIGCYGLSAGAVIAVLGGFTNQFHYKANGLGEASINLNALFNPQGWSSIFPDLPLYGSLQYEGLAYLGCGVICLLAIVYILMVIRIFSLKKLKRWNIQMLFKEEFVALVFLIILCSLFSLSPVITMGDQIIIDYQKDTLLCRLWAVFRSTGRFIWPVVYLIMIICCIKLIKLIKQKYSTIILMFLIGMQIYDIQEQLWERHEIFSQKVQYESLLMNKEFWEKVADNKNIEHIVFEDFIPFNQLFSITDWALDHGKTMNYFYFGRSMNETLFENQRDALNVLSEKDLFIFPHPGINEYHLERYDLNYYEVGEWIVGYAGEV